MNKMAILDRAFDKCAKLEAGQTVKLAPLEEKILRNSLWCSYKLHRIRRVVYRYGEAEVCRVGFVRIGRRYD